MTDLPRNAEDLSEEQMLELMGMQDARELLEFILENDILNTSVSEGAENIIRGMGQWIGNEDLMRFLQVNELSPQYLFTEDYLQEVLDDRFEDEDDGQPSHYEEMQDYFGGDDNPADHMEML